MKQLKDIYTGKIYADKAVLAASPRTKKKQLLTFFTIGRQVTCAELEQEYARRGLAPVDLCTLAAYMEVHKDEDLRATQWKNKDGNFCCATFSAWGGGRGVSVRRNDYDWDGPWSVGGVPDESSASDLNPLKSP